MWMIWACNDVRISSPEQYAGVEFFKSSFLNLSSPQTLIFFTSLVPRPLSSFPLLDRTASDGKLGKGPGTRLMFYQQLRDNGYVGSGSWRTFIYFPGVCLGLQIAVIEFARNVLGLKGRITWCVTWTNSAITWADIPCRCTVNWVQLFNTTSSGMLCANGHFL